MDQKENTEEIQPRRCFVVGPIGANGTPIRTHADWLLDGIIMPTFSEHFTEFTVIRSDRIAEPGMIDSQMITHLLDDDLVIVDMSFQNANAFYEMGIRHMENKPTIHMFLKGTDIPFDVKPYRAIEFSVTDYSDLNAAKVALRQAVEETLKPSFKVENPVTRARGIQQVARSATPTERLLLEEVMGLKARLALLERAEFPTHAPDSNLYELFVRNNFGLADRQGVIGLGIPTLGMLRIELQNGFNNDDRVKILKGLTGALADWVASAKIEGNYLVAQLHAAPGPIQQEKITDLVSAMPQVQTAMLDGAFIFVRAKAR
jgi:hypothetical protein